MKKESACFLVFLLLSAFVFDTQATDEQTVEGVLHEIGRQLDSIKCVNSDCRDAIDQLRDWQERKLKLASSPESSGISILTPKNSTIVPGRPIVKGTVRDRNSEVWVIIHPMEVSDYWVQPRTTVRGDGSWSVYVYIGRPGAVDVGKHFEIRAVANPKNKLREGKVLNYWPDADGLSPIIEVVRK